jgi:hypothetical protein
VFFDHGRSLRIGRAFAHGECKLYARTGNKSSQRGTNLYEFIAQRLLILQRSLWIDNESLKWLRHRRNHLLKLRQHGRVFERSLILTNNAFEWRASCGPRHDAIKSHFSPDCRLPIERLRAELRNGF